MGLESGPFSAGRTGVHLLNLDGRSVAAPGLSWKIVVYLPS